MLPLVPRNDENKEVIIARRTNVVSPTRQSRRGIRLCYLGNNRGLPRHSCYTLVSRNDD
jgi:hypothetical protein